MRECLSNHGLLLSRTHCHPLISMILMNNTYLVSLIVIFVLYVCTLGFISVKMSRRLHHSDERGRLEPSSRFSNSPKVSLELDVILSKDEETGLCRAETIIKNPVSGEHYSYAFYLLVDRKQVDVRWHDETPTFEFMKPDTGQKKEIVAFVKDEQGNVFTQKKAL